MKTEIIKIVTFGRMVVLLGIRALLRENWRVEQTVPVRNNPDKIR